MMASNVIKLYERLKYRYCNVRWENEYISFRIAYDISKDDAIKGLKEIESKFPFIDYDEDISNCYVKVCKSKKGSK